MSFPRYPKYKATAVEWLGDVPAHWEVTRIRRIGSIRYGIGEPPAYHPDGVPLIRATNVHEGAITMDGVVFVSPDEIPAQRTVWLEEGDIIVVRSGAYTGDSAIVPKELPRSIAGFDMVLRCQSADARFVQAALLSYYVKQRQIDIESMRAAQPHLNAEELGACVLLLPPPEEQAAIASFVGSETTKIDALVAEQQRLIELLKEKRQAVISHAVTKGLNPNAKMKPSGVEWLGDIPAHWRLRRLKHVSPNMTVGVVVNPSDLVSEDGLPFVYGGDIREGVIDWVKARRIAPTDSERNEKTLLHAGDLLVVRVGAPGVTAVVPPECEGGNCASVMLMRKGAFNSEWLAMVMNTRVVRYQVEVVQYGAAQEQFNIGHAINFWVPVPPRDEQDCISEHCMRAMRQMDQLIDGAERAIALLQERRVALISAAVTGQIDVRPLGVGAAT